MQLDNHKWEQKSVLICFLKQLNQLQIILEVVIAIILFSCDVKDKKTNLITSNVVYHIKNDSEPIKIAVGKELKLFKSIDFDSLQLMNNAEVVQISDKNLLLYSPLGSNPVYIVDSSFNVIFHQPLNDKDLLINQASNVWFFNSNVFIFDISNRQIAVLNEKLKLIKYIKKNNFNLFPFYFTKSDIVDENKLLFAGTTLISDEKHINRELYNNLFLINGDSLQIIKEFSVHLNDISESIKNEDLKSSNLNSPYSFYRLKNDFYLFNKTSNEIMKFNISNDNFANIKILNLPEEIFSRHKKMHIDEMNKGDQLSIWNKSGSNILRIFKYKINY